jgi:O-antigen/teichoic acid export membrane protein
MTDRDRDGAPEPPPDRLGSRVTAGAAVFVLGNVANRLIGVLSLAVLGRLLTPDDFGLVALALIVTGFIDAVVNDQFTTGLIRERTLEQGHFDTAFTLGTIWGLGAALVMLAFAGPLAALLDAPDLAAALRWLALVPLLNGLRNPRFALYMRNLDYWPNLVFALVPRLLSTAAAILFAVALGDYWALVISAIVLALASTVVTHGMRPGPLALRLPFWRDFLGFGGWLSAAGVMRFAARKSDAAIVGGLLDLRSVGYYNMGTELATTAVQQLSASIVKATFPGLAAVSADRARLWSGYLKVLETSVAVMAPIAVGIGLAAGEAVRIVVGPQWAEAAPVIALLGPATAIGVISTAAQTVVTVEGRTRGLFMRSLTVFAVQTPLIVLGILALGIMGAVYARVAGIVLSTAMTVAMVSRLTEGSLAETLRRPWRSVVAVVAMAAAVLALDAGVLIPTLGLPAAAGIGPALTALAAKAAVAATVYGAVHLGLWVAVGRPDGAERHVLDLAAAALRRVVGRRKGPDRSGR